MERNREGRATIAYDSLRETAKNFLMGFDSVRRWRLARPRALAGDMDVDDFLQRYAFTGLDLIERHFGDLKGRSVCELGPGDFLVSGLCILAAGASGYAVIDRFPGDYEGPTAKYWYRQARDNWDRFHPSSPWDPGLDPDLFPENYADRLELIREPIETAQTANRFDLICSFQVAEHVSDIDAFAEMHRRLLKPGGVGLHRIDFGPHDIWGYYKDPYVFLRFSETAWSLMGSNRGVPNRKRHHEFIDAFERAGLETQVLMLDRYDAGSIDVGKLRRRYREMPLDSLLVGTGVYLVSAPGGEPETERR